MDDCEIIGSLAADYFQAQTLRLVPIYTSVLISLSGLYAPGLNEEPKHGGLQAAEGGGLLRHRRGAGEVRGRERWRGCQRETRIHFSWCAHL